MAQDGGIFTFGDATFSGTLGAPGKSVAGIVVDPSTGDYTLVEVNGTAVVPTLTPVAATTPTASGNGALPNAPASIGAPTSMVLDDEFNTGSLNTACGRPTGSATTAWRTAPSCCPATCPSGPTAWPCSSTAPTSGGLVSTNPDDGQAGHTGFQIAPTPGKPVFVEFKATLPADGDGQVANWPALWLDGQTWPQDGEIDVMEGGGRFHRLPHPLRHRQRARPRADTVNDLSGTHTYGVLWTTTGSPSSTTGPSSAR